MQISSPSQRIKQLQDVPLNNSDVKIATAPSQNKSSLSEFSLHFQSTQIESAEYNSQNYRNLSIFKYQKEVSDKSDKSLNSSLVLQKSLLKILQSKQPIELEKIEQILEQSNVQQGIELLKIIRKSYQKTQEFNQKKYEIEQLSNKNYEIRNKLILFFFTMFFVIFLIDLFLFRFAVGLRLFQNLNENIDEKKKVLYVWVVCGAVQLIMGKYFYIYHVLELEQLKMYQPVCLKLCFIFFVIQIILLWISVNTVLMT